jgi:NADH dehydrogenase
MVDHLRKRIIIIGAGFSGIYAAKTLSKHQEVEVLLIDRRNYHTFTPLLYQVATCGLEPEEIAYPVRGIFREKDRINFMMGNVEGIDTDGKQVVVRTNGTVRQERYDYLIVAGGSETNYFNTRGAEEFGFGLKDLTEAVKLRNHILRLFERAAWTDDSAKREALTTMVVIGGGPTGLETAGALFELYHHVLSLEYEFLKRVQPRVVLVEATDRVLAPYPEGLQKAALEQLHDLGVEIILSNPVDQIYKDAVHLKDGTIIPAYTLVWAAGVKASPLANMLNVPLSRAGRVPVERTMEVIGLEDVYVSGDMAYLEDKAGKPYPMLIPVAKQQGMLTAHNILNRINGKAQGEFRYVDRGIMATIGRSRAVAWLFYKVQLRGFPAWLAWIALHLITLMGFRNRFNVLINWVWNYFTYDRSARIILAASDIAQAEGHDVELEKIHSL